MLTFHDSDKYVHDGTNKSTAKEQMIFRSYNHKIYTVTRNKIAMCNLNESDQELQDDDKITTYSHVLNIAFIKHFDDKDIPDSIEELNKIYKQFTEND